MTRIANRNPLPAGRTLALLLVCVLACPGCFTVLRDLQATRLRLAKLRTPMSGLPDTYLQFQGKGNKEPRFGFVRPGYLLRQPFDVSVQVGLYDDRRLDQANGQRGCMEIDEQPDGGPLVFAVICADYFTSLGGYNVTFFHNLDGVDVTGPTVFVPGWRADLRIAGDAVDLTFSTRAAGKSTWTDIGTAPYTRNPGLLPSVGANFLNKRGEVGFTSPMLMNGDHPTMRSARTAATPEGMIYEDLMYAEEHMFFVCLFLELGDESAAFDELLDAADHLDSANAQIDSLLAVRGAAPIDAKALAKARKNVDKARGKLDKAQAKLGVGKPKPAGKQINKAIKKADKAALTFAPFENVI